MSKRRATKRQRVTAPVEQSTTPEPAAGAGNAEPGRVTEDGYAVFHWPGPGPYTGAVAGPCGSIARHCELSLPSCDFKQALADGLTFVRWAAGS